MDIEHANAIPLRIILNTFGLKPVKEAKGLLYYPSFSDNEPRAFTLTVNTHTNTWKDGDFSGNAIDLVCACLQQRQENYSISDALDWVSEHIGYYLPPLPECLPDFSETDAQLSFEQQMPLSNGVLLEYIEQRCIAKTHTHLLLKEVVCYSKQHGRKFHFIGLRNAEGGYYLSSPNSKANIGDYAITFIRGTEDKPPGVNIFAGVWDYLSLITQERGKAFKNDCIILNSPHALKDAATYVRVYGYKTLYTWMDNTEQGTALKKFWWQFAKGQPGLEHLPMNCVYAGYKDVNAWHTATRKQRHRK